MAYCEYMKTAATGAIAAEIPHSRASNSVRRFQPGNSNRHFLARLDSPVTLTKHSPEDLSNRNISEGGCIFLHHQTSRAAGNSEAI